MANIPCCNCKFFLYVFIIIFSFLTSFLFLYYRTQNQLTGEIILNNESFSELSAPVKVHTDENGFVHIKAKTKKDAFFVLGMMHARDRLFQIEMNRRIATGTVSEIIGNDTIEIDKFTRAVGFGRRGKKDYEYLSHEESMKTYLGLYQNYVNGFNYWANKNYKSIEYYLLGIKFKNLTIEESLAMKRLFAYAMMCDYNSEVVHHIINDYVGQDFLKILYKKTLTDSPLKNYSIIEKDELEEKYFSKNKTYAENIINPEKLKYSHLNIPKNIIEFEGEEFEVDTKHSNDEQHSNSWAIHGNYTKSGKPLFFNDPHLGNNYPNFHYLAKLYIEEEDNILSGSFIPGLPILLIGNNKYFSFGITTDNRDVSDFVEEKLDNENVSLAKYYYVDDKKYPLEESLEKIYIKGQDKPLDYVVKITRNGPIIDVFRKEFNSFGVNIKYNPKGESPGNAMSFNLFYFQEPADLTVFYNVMFAHDFKTVTDNAEKYEGPALSLAFATVSGDIGYTPLGHFVIKKDPDMLLGKGYLSSYEGNFKKVPRNDTPVLINPPKGYIATANNYPFPPQYKYFFAHYCYQVRASRLNDLLKEVMTTKKMFTIEDGLKILDDTKDVLCLRVKPLIMEILEKYKLRFSKYRNMYFYYDLLSEFDCDFTLESRGSTFYYMFEYKLAANLLLENKGNPDLKGIKNEKAVAGFLSKHTMFYTLYEILRKKIETPLCKRFDPKHTCKDFVFEVFSRMDQYLEDYGFVDNSKKDEVKIKKWGEVHFNYYPHFLDVVPILKKIFAGSFPSGGNRNTIKYSKPKLSTENPLTTLTSANMKLIYDLSDVTQPWYCLDTGNSGNIFSKYYSNLQKDCVNSKLRKFKNYDFKNDKDCLIIKN